AANVAGIKLSFDDGAEVLRWLAQVDERLLIMSGNDSVLCEFGRQGGRAVVSGNAGVFPDVIARSFAAARQHEDAVSESLGMVLRLTKSGSPDRLKELLRSRGIDLGGSRVHAVGPCGAAETALLRQLLERIN
ncbi:MAG: dihydrodipicolinate synthase family protein, partial [Chloroflexota bacterium]